MNKELVFGDLSRIAINIRFKEVVVLILDEISMTSVTGDYWFDLLIDRIENEFDGHLSDEEWVVWKKFNTYEKRSLIEDVLKDFGIEYESGVSEIDETIGY